MSKVLILEDEESIRSFIVINLKRNGFDVLETGDGNEALRMLQTTPDIDIALLDVMVPELTVLKCAAEFGKRTSESALFS